MQKVLVKTGNSKINPKPANLQDDALQQALRFLGYRSRSEAEIRAHLSRRSYPPAAVNRALTRLRSLNYVGDENFAKNWALSRVQSRGFGPLRIEHELKGKGIGDALRRAVVDDLFGAGQETERAKLVLQKRFKGKSFQDPKSLRQAAAFLERQGFSGEAIAELLGLVNRPND